LTNSDLLIYYTTKNKCAADDGSFFICTYDTGAYPSILLSQ